MIQVGENVTKSCVLYKCESYQNNLRYLKVLQGGKQNSTLQHSDNEIFCLLKLLPFG